MRGNHNNKTANSFVLLALLILISVPFASSQFVDSDADGVVDANDACLETNYDEGLPIITRNVEFLGCSCSQILEKKGEHCYDIFCSSGRPFMIKERDYSSRESNCAGDYCINSTLYDFPKNKVLSCSEGIEEKYFCNATIVQNSQMCLNGSVGQFVEIVEIIPEKEVIILDDYEKLQKRAYAISQNNELKTSLGISGEEIFISQSKKTMDSLDIEKNLRTETRVIVDTEKTISIKTIRIIPDKYKTLEDVYVFEELPRESKVQIEEVIPGTEVIYQDENSPVLLVWKIDKISKPVEITYQINKPLSGDSNTLLIAKNIKTGYLKLMILPLIFIGFAILVFMRTSEKSIPKRKKIFKD